MDAARIFALGHFQLPATISLLSIFYLACRRNSFVQPTWGVAENFAEHHLALSLTFCCHCVLLDTPHFLSSRASQAHWTCSLVPWHAPSMAPPTSHWFHHASSSSLDMVLGSAPSPSHNPLRHVFSAQFQRTVRWTACRPPLTGPGSSAPVHENENGMESACSLHSGLGRGLPQHEAYPCGVGRCHLQQP